MAQLLSVTETLHTLRRKGSMKQLQSFRMLTLAVLFVMPMLYGMVGRAAAQVINAPERTQGLIVSPALGAQKLVSLAGPGRFVAAEVVKQGGDSDLTFVILDIDGRNVVNISIAALENSGLTQNNPFGLVLLQSAVGLKTVTIGFANPLAFREELVLSVDVREAGVVQILGNVIHGR
jgi:hypothetical protein